MQGRRRYPIHHQSFTKSKTTSNICRRRFADQNGTHLVCFNIIKGTLNRLKETEDWVKDCRLWIYRAAWQEFNTWEIEMAVLLSPQEVIRKRNAIFKLQSQKDRPVFSGG